MRTINSHFVETKPNSTMQLDILGRYEDGVYINTQEMAMKEDILKLRGEEQAAIVTDKIVKDTSGSTTDTETEMGGII